MARSTLRPLLVLFVIIDTVCSRPKVIATFYPFEMHIVEFYLNSIKF